VRNHELGSNEITDEGIFIVERTESTKNASTQEVNTFDWHGRTTENAWTFVAYPVSIGSAFSTGIMLGLGLSLSITESVAIASSASAVTGGLLFSIVELRKSLEATKRRSR
jgi:hypothetical protein